MKFKLAFYVAATAVFLLAAQRSLAATTCVDLTGEYRLNGDYRNEVFVAEQKACETLRHGYSYGQIIEHSMVEGVVHPSLGSTYWRSNYTAQVTPMGVSFTFVYEDLNQQTRKWETTSINVLTLELDAAKNIHFTYSVQKVVNGVAGPREQTEEQTYQRIIK